jgi:hypothetical protein
LHKVRIIAIIGIILFVIYVGLIITNISLDYLGEYELLVFSIILALISINMINKGILLRSTTTLWFALNMIIFAIVIIICELLSWDIANVGYIWSLIPILPSIINLIVFNNYIYIKLIIINVFIIIPLIINSLVVFSFWIEMGFIAGGIVIGIITCRLINFDKENV